jgi:hypothetical protein
MAELVTSGFRSVKLKNLKLSFKEKTMTLKAKKKLRKKELKAKDDHDKSFYVLSSNTIIIINMNL